MIIFNHQNGCDFIASVCYDYSGSMTIKNFNHHRLVADWIGEVIADLEKDCEEWISTQECNKNWEHRVWSYEVKGQVIVITNCHGTLYMHCGCQSISIVISDLKELHQAYKEQAEDNEK